MILSAYPGSDERGVSRDVPEAEQGAVPGTRVVTGFLGVDPDIWAGRQHRGGASKGAIKLYGADWRSAPLHLGKRKRTEGWPGTQVLRAAKHCLRGLFEN